MGGTASPRDAGVPTPARERGCFGNGVRGGRQGKGRLVSHRRGDLRTETVRTQGRRCEDTGGGQPSTSQGTPEAPGPGGEPAAGSARGLVPDSRLCSTGTHLCLLSPSPVPSGLGFQPTSLFPQGRTAARGNSPGCVAFSTASAPRASEGRRPRPIRTRAVQRPPCSTHRSSREAWESIQPVAAWDTVVTFQPWHTWDPWLSPLTWERICGVRATQAGAAAGGLWVQELPGPEH